VKLPQGILHADQAVERIVEADHRAGVLVRLSNQAIECIVSVVAGLAAAVVNEVRLTVEVVCARVNLAERRRTIAKLIDRVVGE